MASDNIAWDVAGGIVMAALIITGLDRCQQAIALQAAITELNASSSQPARVARAPGADPFAQMRATVIENERIRRAALVPDELPIGYRCIGKQLFRRLPNGFEQITDGSAPRYCK